MTRMNRRTTSLITTALLLAALGLLATPAAAQQPAFDSGNLAQGATFTWTAEQAGTYGYHCEYHGGMDAEIHVVEGEPGDPVEIQIEGFAYSPSNVTVTVGTEITWTNLDGASHTVTADMDAPTGGSMAGNSSMEGNGSMSEGNASMEDDGSMEGNGSMSSGNGSMGEEEAMGDEASMDDGSMDDGDGAMMDGEDEPASTPGLAAGLLLLAVIASALVAARRR